MQTRKTSPVRTRRRLSAIPIYIAGGAWALYACVFPLYRAWHFLPAIGVAAAAFLAARHFFPDTVAEEALPPDTGDRNADAVIARGREMLAELRSLDDAIGDPEISGQIVRMTAAGEGIFACIAADPEKTPRIRQFMNYFLPTALKLLRAYGAWEAQGAAGEHVSSAMEGVRGIMGQVADAFARQLDTLYQGDALDIAAEITVMETMLAREGLAECDFAKKQEV